MPSFPEMTDPETIYADLARLGLIRPGDRPPAAPLTGGVSSDIWKVDLPPGPVAVKRALAKLKVAQDWRAPVGRSRYEIRWFRTVARIIPEAVPRIVAADEEAGVFAMSYLDPAGHPLWKRQLFDGHVEVGTAEEVGRCLALIHSATARDKSIPGLFPTDAIFHDIRLSPYLEAAAAKHPDRADALHRIVETTVTTRRALVHGDVSPKNILVGPSGPIFLDAECAWFGDPAFDLDAHVLEQAGGEQRAQRRRGLVVGVGLADAERQRAEHRARIGALQAFDPDVLDHERFDGACRRGGHDERGRDGRGRDETGEIESEHDRFSAGPAGGRRR